MTGQASAGFQNLYDTFNEEYISERKANGLTGDVQHMRTLARYAAECTNPVAKILKVKQPQKTQHRRIDTEASIGMLWHSMLRLMH
mmetsp:Transcript_13478/g.20216  ORF Transcript_13478/g.20216 Transcript_13478/m.20216 type:complete len:86 (+) Transcript_13478:35-292(+)